MRPPDELRRNGTGDRRRVLVAEDRGEVRSLVVRLLRDEGYEPLEAEDGAAALALIRGGGVDIALIGVLLPRVSGMAVLKEARRFTTPESLPILFFTGPGGIGAAEARRHGANDCVTRPILPADLLRAVRTTS